MREEKFENTVIKVTVTHPESILQPKNKVAKITETNQSTLIRSTPTKEVVAIRLNTGSRRLDSVITTSEVLD